MDHQEQLSWEQRVGRTVAIAAFAAAILLFAALVYSNAAIKQEYTDAFGHTVTIKGSADNVEQMFILHAHKGQFLIASILQAVSTMLFAPLLWFLYKVTAYRRSEIPAIGKWLAIVAPVASGLLFLISRIQVSHVSDKVVNTLSKAPLRPDDANQFAKDHLTSGSLQTIGGLGLAAGLAMALALVLICVNAMRAGTLSRFMGIIGIIVGVLLVLPIFGNVPFIQIFWAGALGVLFLDRWPQGGRGPAWTSGEAIPWPTAADRQARIAEARADREAAEEEERERPAVAAAGRRPGAAAALEDRDDEADGNGAGPARRQAAQHPRSKKRKRKRR